MTRIECPGLDGSNPLHFLASLGVLRVLHRVHPGTRLGWIFDEKGCRPQYSRTDGDWSLDGMCRELHAWIVELGKTCGSGSAGVPKGDDAADRLGQGVAHLGDVVSVSPAVFRAKAVLALKALLEAGGTSMPSTGDPFLVTSQLPGLACDQVCEDGKLRYTPYSFSNGGSGQCLLKDFRACARAVEMPHLHGALLGRPCYVRTVSSLGWDPCDQAHYAMQWQAPEEANRKGSKDVNPALQVLGYLGLSLVPAVPVDGLTAVGWRRTDEGRAIAWPIWCGAFTLDVVKAVLDAEWSIKERRAVGIQAVFTCSVQNPNKKRNFFSPSRSV